MGQCPPGWNWHGRFSTNPQVLFLDELTANLDEDTAWDMFLFLEELNRLGTTVIMASHAKRFINLMRRRVITLVDGRILGDSAAGHYGIWSDRSPPQSEIPARLRQAV